MLIVSNSFICQWWTGSLYPNNCNVLYGSTASAQACWDDLHPPRSSISACQTDHWPFNWPVPPISSLSHLPPFLRPYICKRQKNKCFEDLIYVNVGKTKLELFSAAIRSSSLCASPKVIFRGWHLWYPEHTKLWSQEEGWPAAPAYADHFAAPDPWRPVQASNEGEGPTVCLTLVN